MDILTVFHIFYIFLYLIFIFNFTGRSIVLIGYRYPQFFGIFVLFSLAQFPFLQFFLIYLIRLLQIFYLIQLLQIFYLIRLLQIFYLIRLLQIFYMIRLLQIFYMIRLLQIFYMYLLKLFQQLFYFQ